MSASLSGQAFHASARIPVRHFHQRSPFATSSRGQVGRPTRIAFEPRALLTPGGDLAVMSADRHAPDCTVTASEAGRIRCRSRNTGSGSSRSRSGRTGSSRLVSSTAAAAASGSTSGSPGMQAGAAAGSSVRGGAVASGRLRARRGVRGSGIGWSGGGQGSGLAGSQLRMREGEAGGRRPPVTPARASLDPDSMPARESSTRTPAPSRSSNEASGDEPDSTAAAQPRDLEAQVRCCVCDTCVPGARRRHC